MIFLVYTLSQLIFIILPEMRLPHTKRKHYTIILINALFVQLGLVTPD